MPTTDDKQKQQEDLQTYPCKFPIRDHARNAGPPKKSSKSVLLTLNFWSRINTNRLEIQTSRGAKLVLTQFSMHELPTKVTSKRTE